MTTYLDQDADLTDVFVGHKIVAVEMPVARPEGFGWPFSGTDPVGLLTLDDGTKVYACGNEGGCACSAGDYELTKLAAVDNIITAVKVIAQPDSDSWSGRGPYEPGRYSIFVVAEAQELTIAEFEGSDGNGYYGTGFRLAVIPA